MKKNIFLIVFLFSSLLIFAQDAIKDDTQNDVTTYFLIRHAEKRASDEINKDPGLNNEGIKRTKKWVNLFKNIKFDAIYSTDYKRTKQTAKPIADSNKLPMLGYNSNSMYEEGFKYNTNGKTILIVGHSNTTPTFVNTILDEKKYEQIKEDNYSNLYIVTEVI